MDQLKDLKARSERAFDVQLQKQNLLEACRARQIFAYNGGIFKANEELISFLNALTQQEKNKVIIIDHNENPVEIIVKELLDRAIQRYQESLNTYHSIYKNIRG